MFSTVPDGGICLSFSVVVVFVVGGGVWTSVPVAVVSVTGGGGCGGRDGAW